MKTQKKRGVLVGGKNDNRRNDKRDQQKRAGKRKIESSDEASLTSKEIAAQQQAKLQETVQERIDSVSAHLKRKRMNPQPMDSAITRLINESNTIVNVNDIDRFWVNDSSRKLNFLRFLPLVSKSELDEYCIATIEDCRFLLSLESHIFWSHVVYNGSLDLFLQSFLPGALSLLMEASVSRMFEDLSMLVFRIFHRISQQREDNQRFLSPEFHKRIISRLQCCSTCSILDFVSIYYSQNSQYCSSVVRKILAASEARFVEEFHSFLNGLKSFLTAILVDNADGEETTTSTGDDLSSMLQTGLKSILFLILILKDDPNKKSLLKPLFESDVILLVSEVMYRPSLQSPEDSLFSLYQVCYLLLRETVSLVCELCIGDEISFFVGILVNWMDRWGKGNDSSSLESQCFEFVYDLLLETNVYETLVSAQSSLSTVDLSAPLQFVVSLLSQESGLKESDFLPKEKVISPEQQLEDEMRLKERNEKEMQDSSSLTSLQSMFPDEAISDLKSVLDRHNGDVDRSLTDILANIESRKQYKSPTVEDSVRNTESRKREHPPPPRTSSHQPVNPFESRFEYEDDYDDSLESDPSMHRDAGSLQFADFETKSYSQDSSYGGGRGGGGRGGGGQRKYLSKRKEKRQ